MDEQIETPYKLPSDPRIEVYQNQDGQIVIRQAAESFNRRTDSV
jgi:hypothetical protein